MTPEAIVVKLFTAVIYCHFKVIPSFCVLKPYHLSNNSGMTVNYHGICVTNVINKIKPKWQYNIAVWL